MVGCTACFSVECRGSASEDINSQNITEDTVVYQYIPSANENKYIKCGRRWIPENTIIISVFKVKSRHHIQR